MSDTKQLEDLAMHIEEVEDALERAKTARAEEMQRLYEAGVHIGAIHAASGLSYTRVTQLINRRRN